MQGEDNRVTVTKDILVIIPAYNEERAIAGLIATIKNVAGIIADIVVIDDGSSDSTVQAASDAGAVVIKHPFNMGYGSTIQTGYKFAFARGYKYLVQIDGDGQHDPAFIPALLKPIIAGSADLALGSRFLDKSSYRPPLIRRVGIAFFGNLISFIIGRRVSDPTSGFQAFNRSVLGFFTSDAFPCDYPDADVLLVLGLAGFEIAEVPVKMYANQDGKSMHNGLKPLYYIFKMLLSIAVTLMRRRIAYTGVGRLNQNAD